MEEYDARTYAGEDSDDVRNELFGNVLHQEYIPAMFYFTIDAVTGKRIDIWRSVPFRNFTEEESIAISEFMQNKEDDEITDMFAIELTPQEIATLSQMAVVYANKHFTNTFVVNDELIHASNNIDVDAEGNIFFRPGFATFDITDNTGRVASVTIYLTNMLVTSISTMQNDMLPFDYTYMPPNGGDITRDGERVR